MGGLAVPVKVKVCVDCVAEGRPLTRTAPYPGPRCYTHSLAKKRARRVSAKDAHVQRTYSLTPEQYNALLAFQGGKCYICGRRPGRKRLAVDHDHACCPGPISCGRCVRGLVDSHCNHKIIGWLRDSPEAFERGAAYLRSWPSRRAGIVPPR